MRFLLPSILLFTVAQAETFDAMLDGLLKDRVEQISTEELSKELKGSNPPLLLDTRMKKEFEVSHLKDAKHFGYIKVDYDLLSKLDKDAVIVTYCSVGKRSEDIGEALQRKGFTNIRNLRGGIFQWANEKRPIYGKEDKKTNTVHPYNKTWGKWLKPHLKKEK